MVKPGVKPKTIIKTKWSPKLAYAIGLLASDGCLYNDGRHIDFTSADKDLVKLFQECLKLDHIKIGIKSSGDHSSKQYWRLQFGSRLFYDWLLEIGLTPKKSLTLGEIKVPQELFFHLLRGIFDGDGTFYSYWDKRWRSSFMFYTVFVSASLQHVTWLREELWGNLGIKGHLNKSMNYYQLKYAKTESLILLKSMYGGRANIYLPRKLLKINKALSIINEKV